MGRPEKIRLGEILVQQKLLTEEQLKSALDVQKKSGRRLGRVVIETRLATEEQISEALARQLDIPYINLKYFNIKRDLKLKLSEVQARRFRALVLDDSGATCKVAMADPTDLMAYDEIVRVLRREIDISVVTETELLKTIDRLYRQTEQISGLAQELQANLADDAVDFGALALTPGLEEAPVVKLLQTIFEDAVQARASDVHIEPQEKRLLIRFRIDGVLHLQTEADPKIASVLVLRLNLMSGLDISEKRLPQGGRDGSCRLACWHRQRTQGLFFPADAGRVSRWFSSRRRFARMCCARQPRQAEYDRIASRLSFALVAPPLSVEPVVAPALPSRSELPLPASRVIDRNSDVAVGPVA